MMDRETLLSVLESTAEIANGDDPSRWRTKATVLPNGETVAFRVRTGPEPGDVETLTARRVDHGTFVPHHELRRIACSGCGAMHWEPRQKSLSFRFCPHCAALFTGFEEPREISQTS